MNDPYEESPFAVHDSDLTHWPELWPLAAMPLTVRRFRVFAVLLHLGLYVRAVWILRRMQAARGPRTPASRHPLITLGLLVTVFGFAFDVALECTFDHASYGVRMLLVPW